MVDIELVTLRQPNAEILWQIRALLDFYRLPSEDIGQSDIHFIVAQEHSRVVGCIGVEEFGQDGLLRSFAVAENHRNTGLGAQLLDQLLEDARETGITTLHLLTTTAEKYFASKGFALGNRLDAPASIRQTNEFANLCPSTATYMTYAL